MDDNIQFMVKTTTVLTTLSIDIENITTINVHISWIHSAMVNQNNKITL